MILYINILVARWFRRAARLTFSSCVLSHVSCPLLEQNNVRVVESIMMFVKRSIVWIESVLLWSEVKSWLFGADLLRCFAPTAVIGGRMTFLHIKKSFLSTCSCFDHATALALPSYVWIEWFNAGPLTIGYICSVSSDVAFLILTFCSSHSMMILSLHRRLPCWAWATGKSTRRRIRNSKTRREVLGDKRQYW